MANRKNPIYDLAYNDYQEGMSLEKIADKYGVTRQGVFKAFKLRGFALRSPNLQPEKEFDGKKFTLRPIGYYALTTDDRIYLHRYVWTFYNGPIPKGWDVHHMDEDKSNCEINNLQCLPKSEHAGLHGFRNNQFTKAKRCG